MCKSLNQHLHGNIKPKQVVAISLLLVIYAYILVKKVK